MTGLLAEDLLLLCWDDDKARSSSDCSPGLDAGVAAALVIDALMAGSIEVGADGRVRPGSAAADDPLVAEVVEEAGRRRRHPKVHKLVEGLSSGQRSVAVRDRLVESGMLRAERRRLLGLVPVTRYPVADPAAVATVRQQVRALLVGEREPADGDLRWTALAGLAKPTKALERLVDRRQRKAARQRADAFAVGHGVPEVVSETFQQAQAAAVAAVAAAATANSQVRP